MPAPGKCGISAKQIGLIARIKRQRRRIADSASLTKTKAAAPSYHRAPEHPAGSKHNAEGGGKTARKGKGMIYSLEKRHEFSGGTMTTHWEVRSYTHRTPIGVLANGTTLKSGTKVQCEKYIRTKGIQAETV